MKQTHVNNASAKIRTILLSILSISLLAADAFVAAPNRCVVRSVTAGLVTNQLNIAETSDPNPSKDGDTKTDIHIDTDIDAVRKLPLLDVKAQLLDLLPRMTGTPTELSRVQNYINAIEEKYTPPQTIDFLNLAMTGEWQLLFSTSKLRRPTTTFRLREMYQKIEPNNLKGNITNVMKFDFAQGSSGNDYEDSNSNKNINEDEDSYDPTGGGAAAQIRMAQRPAFDVSGTFSVRCNYEITNGARKALTLDDMSLDIDKDNTFPRDPQALVGVIANAIPKEMFDPNEHGMDTTYLDLDLRIVRLTGPKFEGTRSVFIRKGCVQF